jgi:hypothetical protein
MDKVIEKTSCSIHPKELLREDGSCLTCARFAALAAQVVSEYTTLTNEILTGFKKAGEAWSTAEGLTAAESELVKQIQRMRKILSCQG